MAFWGPWYWHGLVCKAIKYRCHNFRVGFLAPATTPGATRANVAFLSRECVWCAMLVHAALTSAARPTARPRPVSSSPLDLDLPSPEDHRPSDREDPSEGAAAFEGDLSVSRPLLPPCLLRSAFGTLTLAQVCSVPSSEAPFNR